MLDQSSLLAQLKLIFPAENKIEALVNNRHLSLVSQDSSAPLELDIYIPSFNICFEFQDSYHYTTTWYAHRYVKKEVVHGQNITFIVVPCWWDGSLQSLVSCISFARPDIVFEKEFQKITDLLIPLNPPKGYFPEREIDGVGELMLASFSDDSNFSSSLSEENPWWIGEKYDGIRCCWNSDQQLLHGRILRITKSISENFPDIFSDGELWFGRGQFSFADLLIKTTSNFHYWDFLRMVVFDVPSYPLQKTEFEKRYSLLLSNLSFENPSTIIAPRIKCTNNIHLKILTKEILEEEGEGIILRKQNSFYEHGRNPNLIKLKGVQLDREAIVIENSKSRVKLKLPDGTTLQVPQDAIYTKKIPKIGEIVTLTYEKNARRDVVARPKIIRVRNDLLWSDVLKNFSAEEEYSKAGTPKPQGYWSQITMRKFLEDFAKNKNLNPLDPHTWYSISAESIRNEKGGKTLLEKFKGGYTQMLQRLFPEIKFDYSKFLSFPAGYWEKIENRRLFFENYAKENNFDAQDPQNWYYQAKDHIMSSKGANRVIFYHNYSIPQALVDLFPNIGLEKSKFMLKRPEWLPEKWSYKRNRRKFFEDYAEANDFICNDPHNWYKQSRDNIMSFEGAERVIAYHNNSVAKSLCDLFPNIGLDKSNFLFKWQNKDYRRKFFEKYAKANSFDPLIAKEWYKQSKHKFLAYKNADKALQYHNGNFVEALLTLFPDINLDSAGFNLHDWSEKDNRRFFFENYAKQNNFDPLIPENWYSHPLDKIFYSKGARGVLHYHKQRVVDALLDLFPDIGLQIEHFRSTWRTVEKRKQFFLSFAKENNFEIMVAENWNKKTREKFLSLKGARMVISYHSNSLSRALSSLFPNIK